MRAPLDVAQVGLVDDLHGDALVGADVNAELDNAVLALAQLAHDPVVLQLTSKIEI